MNLNIDSTPQRRGDCTGSLPFWEVWSLSTLHRRTIQALAELLLFETFIYLFLCVCMVCLHVCLHIACIPGAHGSPEEGIILPYH